VAVSPPSTVADTVTEVAEKEGVNYRERCEQFLKKLEAQLMPFLAGDAARLVDMAIFPFIRQLSMVDIEWFDSQPYPSLKAWLDYFTSSSLFQMVMQKYPTWSPCSQPTLVVF